MVSEEILSQFGNAFAKAILGIKGAIDRFSTYVSLINSCDPLTSRAAVASISFVGAAFGRVVKAIAVAFPIIALTVAIVGMIFVGLLMAGWANSPKCRGDE